MGTDKTLEVMGLLRAWGSGGRAALDRLMPPVYSELRRRSRKCPGGDPIFVADRQEVNPRRIFASPPAVGGEAGRPTHRNSKAAYPAPLKDQTLLSIASAESGAGSWKNRFTHRANLGVEAIPDGVAKESDATPLKLPALRAVSLRYGSNYLLYLSAIDLPGRKPK